MHLKESLVREIREIYKSARERIEERLEEFKALWREASDERLFAELAFCLLTPQSRAKLCWAAVERLMDSGLLYTGDPNQISPFLRGIRFRGRKATYIVQARDLFSGGGRLRMREVISSLGPPEACRWWLVKNVRGMGFKEASHFLRNVGLGENLAILDRHVLRTLAELGAIPKVPTSLSPKTYLALEKAFREVAGTLGIPVAHLDFVMWCRKTGEIFK